MLLIKLKKILDALKNHISIVTFSFKSPTSVDISYDNGTYYCTKLNLNLDNSNCPDFSCDINDLIKALDCLNSRIDNTVCLENSFFVSGGKRVKIEILKPITHQFIAVNYTDNLPRTSLQEALDFTLRSTSEALPAYEFLQFFKGKLQGSKGYLVHEYLLPEFTHEFSLHKSGVAQTLDLLEVLEEFDILNDTEYIRGASWTNGYAFAGGDSDFSFEVILITSKFAPFNFQFSGDKRFKLNRRDLYDVCIQANKSKSSYIRFYSLVQGSCNYSFTSNTGNLFLGGVIPVIGDVPDFKVDTGFLYNALFKGRIVTFQYSDSKNPFMISTENNRSRAYVAPLT